MPSCTMTVWYCF